MVWVHAPLEVLTRRLAQRGLARDAAKLGDPDAWVREARPEQPPVVAHVDVDGTLAVDVAARTLLDALAAQALRS